MASLWAAFLGLKGQASAHYGGDFDVHSWCVCLVPEDPPPPPSPGPVPSVLGPLTLSACVGSSSMTLKIMDVFFLLWKTESCCDDTEEITEENSSEL